MGGIVHCYMIKIPNELLFGSCMYIFDWNPSAPRTTDAQGIYTIKARIYDYF
jgi:hypothetical protein